MSKKTFFKRMSLGVIAALGFGLLSTPTAQAVRLTNTLSLSAATASTTTFDTASVTLTLRQTSTQNGQDSMTVRVSCDAPTGATCPTLKGYQDPNTADTLNVQVAGAAQGSAQVKRTLGAWTDLSGWSESQVEADKSMRSVISVKGENFPAAGTYTYTIYATGNGGASDVITGTSTTWTVTVTAPSTNATGGSANVYISEDAVTASLNRNKFLTATDSAIVASRGLATAPTVVGYAFLNLRNAAGDTRVAAGDGFLPVQDSVTVTVSGPGLVSVSAAGASSAKSVTMSVTNSRVAAANHVYGAETLSILSDGTAGTMTITFSKGSTTLATKTVTFYGAPGGVTPFLSDTVTALRTAGTSTVTLTGVLRDAATGGNILSAGTVYVFSSDTKIAGAVPTTAVFGQTGHRCTTFTGTGATSKLACPITLTDTGVVTLTVGDSWTVAGSSWTSTGVELTVTGNTVASATVAFDKATYAPGERAVITITTKDIAGRANANGATGTLAAAFSNYTLTGSTTLPYRGTSTSSTDVTYSTTLTPYEDSGVETRVVTMPTIGADITYTIHVPGFGVGSSNTPVTATAKVVDPNATAIAAAQAATVAAAEAANDAAAEAIDAANAATDAANLAAEAADAATVAAEEARDAADAATAAVEELATQVATLMAALKAQITTLANTVAKIAKKVKA
jgi:hypothetical protein